MLDWTQHAKKASPTVDSRPTLASILKGFYIYSASEQADGRGMVEKVDFSAAVKINVSICAGMT